ncbi:MAG: hypothetical protein WCO44_11780 [Bacteroidota bacterium]
MAETNSGSKTVTWLYIVVLIAAMAATGFIVWKLKPPVPDDAFNTQIQNRLKAIENKRISDSTKHKQQYDSLCTVLANRDLEFQYQVNAYNRLNATYEKFRLRMRTVPDSTAYRIYTEYVLSHQNR